MTSFQIVVVTETETLDEAAVEVARFELASRRRCDGHCQDQLRTAILRFEAEAFDADNVRHLQPSNECYLVKSFVASATHSLTFCSSDVLQACVALCYIVNSQLVLVQLKSHDSLAKYCLQRLARL